MKIRKSAASATDKVEQQMTPMIDVVFQMLTFFLFSFKIATQEGDFNIKMPLAAPGTSEASEPYPPIRVSLTADGTGNLAGIRMNDRGLSGFTALHNEIMRIVGTDTGPGSVVANTEVELDCHYNLRYVNVVRAITAVSGHIDQNGRTVRLIEKIKFAPPRAP